MKATARLRSIFGLTQQDMANYLSVSQSLLALCETGKRSLPTAALLKLGEMELFLNKPPVKNINPPHVKLQQAKAWQLLEKHAKLQACKEALMQRKLKAAQKIYSQKMLLLQLVDHLAGDSKTPARSRHSAWVKMVRANALDGIERNGLHLQAMQQVHISGIRGQYEQAIKLKPPIVK